MNKAQARKEARKIAATVLSSSQFETLDDEYSPEDAERIKREIKAVIWMLIHPGTSVTIWESLQSDSDGDSHGNSSHIEVR